MRHDERSGQAMRGANIAVVIPCYRVKDHILSVLSRMPPEVWRIYVVDDACPDGSGDHVEARCADGRVRVLRHRINQGVGGATVTGYRQAIADGAGVVVKIDGDGQMDPGLLPDFVRPIVAGEADYAKGNRFYDPRSARSMPALRFFGNAALSFVAKISGGYWRIFDPTNGYTALHAGVAARLPLDRLSRRYFFESDMLFRLNCCQAVVVDIPMEAVYGDEKSGLKVSRVFWSFLYRHLVNAGKRLFYNYFLRDVNMGSLGLLAGVPLFLFGTVFGLATWAEAVSSPHPTPTGTIMLAILPTLVGLQLLLVFLGIDIANAPSRPLQLNSLFAPRAGGEARAAGEGGEA